MGFLLKFLGFITKPFKWAYSILPGFRDGTAKWAQSMIYYVALGATVYAVCKFPMVPNWAEVLIVFSSALLLSFITVVRTRVSISEADVKLIQDQKVELESALEKERLKVTKLKEDMRNQRTQFLDMSWIWEVNLAQVRLERIKLFDYFVRKNESPIPWKERPERILEHDKRAIGALKIDYTAKIGIDLKQVLVHHDAQEQLVKYWIPEPYQTGALDPSDDWAIRCAMNYTTGKGMMDLSLDWRWHDEESLHSALQIWENEKSDRYKDAFASQELNDQLGTAIRNEADRRLKSFFETLLNCKAVAVSKEQLEHPDTLGVLLPSLMKERTPLLNSTGVSAA